MGESRRLPAVAALALLLVATATADEPSPPGGGAVAGGAEPRAPGPARLEASGESDLSTSGQHLGQAVTSLAFPGSPLATEPRDPRDPREPRPGATPAPRAARSAPDPCGGRRSQPGCPSPVQRVRGGGERDPDSEEALEAQGI